jgi:hypothetical protein
VSTEVPDDTILRALAHCPECIEADSRDAELARLRDENAALRQRLTSDVAGLSPDYGEEMSRLRRELADARAMLQGKDDAIADLEGELRKAKDNYGKLFAAKHVTIEMPAEPQEVLLLRMAETSKQWAMDYHRERQLRIDQAKRHELDTDRMRHDWSIALDSLADSMNTYIRRAALWKRSARCHYRIGKFAIAENKDLRVKLDRLVDIAREICEEERDWKGSEVRLGIVYLEEAVAAATDAAKGKDHGNE